MEDEHTEFKKSLAEKERGYKALAAMLNKHCSGTVYFGVDDVGTAECRRIDAFELWCWKRLLRVPCTASRSNQSILKEISPGC